MSASRQEPRGDGEPCSGALSAAQRDGVYRAIERRRDIRNFRPDPIPEPLLLRLLAAAHRAPSVGLSQPWRFVVVRSRATRREVYRHFAAVNERAAREFRGDRRESYRALKLQGILDAPVNLLVTCERPSGEPPVLGRFTMRHMDEYSTCLAVENLWLAARAEGVGVGWMSLMEPAFIAELFALPEGTLPVAYLTLGYPVEFPPEPTLQQTGWRKRMALSEVVFEERYGAPALLASGSRANREAAETRREASPQAARGKPGAASPQPPSPTTQSKARLRQAELTKPAGSLGKLEELGVRLAELQGREHPDLGQKILLLFAADHGITAEGVSAYERRATAQMVYQFLSGGAAVNVLCRLHGVDLAVADVGVDHDFGAAAALHHEKVRRGSRNFCEEPAMTEPELEAALQVGARAVHRAAGAAALALGEMGIGNTTSAAALLAALTGASADRVVGLGTGASAGTLKRKAEVVRRGLELHRPASAMQALRTLGGLEIAALVGAIVAAAEGGKLVVLDGFTTAVAALLSAELEPRVRSCLVASHLGAERAHGLVLQRLELTPLLALSLRLGEGTGAVLGLSLLESAVALMREMRTYEEANVARPLDPRNEPGGGA